MVGADNNNKNDDEGVINKGKTVVVNLLLTTTSAGEKEDKDNRNVQTKSSSSHSGANVSGRSWKVQQQPQKRASSLIMTKMNNRSTSWERKCVDRVKKRQALLLQATLQEAKIQEKLQKKQRRLENETRRQENEVKAAAVKSSVQTLNVNKIGVTLKNMSKKQLRQIKKTRLNTKTGVIEYVPAYSK